MIVLALLLLAVVALTSCKVPRSKYTDDLRNCKYDRNDAIDCVQKYGDSNHDRLLTPDEIIVLKREMFYIWEKAVLLLHPQDDIMDHCDHDRDGVISERDFDESFNTCLHTCADVTDFNYYICDRAKKWNYVAKLPPPKRPTSPFASQQPPPKRPTSPFTSQHPTNKH